MEEQDKATSQLLFEVVEMSDRNENNKTKQLDSWNVQPMQNTEVHYKRKGKRRHFKLCSFCIYFIYGILMFLFGMFVTIILLHFWNPSVSSELLKTISSPISLNKIYDKGNDLKSLNIMEDELKEEFAKCCPNFEHKSLRLLDTILPISYDIKVYPNIKNLNLNGNITINMKVESEENLIVIHADRLKMSKYKIKVNGEKVKSTFKECSCQEQWLFELDNEVNEGDLIELYIEYSGKIQTDMGGLYLNEHRTKNNLTARSIVTQFEPAMARRFIPCFDEPYFKATFNLSIIREPHHISRSNMPIVHSEEFEYNNNLMIDYFAPTVKMSTYILAMGVFDDFKKVRRISKNTSKPIEINLLAGSQVIANQSDFGLTTSIMALEFFENYFDIPYPLPKIDLVGLSTFLESAMENFGMVTFRDSSILFNEHNSTSRAKQHIANVMAHEMAHQYFGNLVTFKWWNDLWLSEGFATLLEYYCLSNLFPTWKPMEAFYVDNYINSMIMDGMLSSHPVSSDVEKAADISSLFDAISYGKGAAVIQMIKGITGDNAFQKSLKEYLKTYSYKNAEGKDIWNIIQKHVEISSDVTINELAEAWTLKMGYPIVRMSWGKSKSEIIISNQTRFLFLEEDRIHDRDYKWPIPIHYVTDSIKDSRLIWFKEDDENVRLDLGKTSKWFIANTDSKGYFRVLYDNDNYKAIVKQLKINHRKIKSLDRSIIINDAFAFVRSGYLDVGEALNLIEYLAKGVEKDRSPWYVTNMHLSFIDNILKDSQIYDDFQDFKRYLILNSYENLEWDKLVHITDKLYQSEIFGMACHFEIHHCLKQSKLLFKKWSRNKDLIPIDLQKVVIDEGVRQGGKQEWELVFKEYLLSTNPSQKDLYLTALTQTKDIKLINRLLNYCLDSSIIKPNIMSKVISNLMSNDVASVHVWRFFKINIKKFIEVSPSVYRLIRSLVSRFSTEYEYDTLVALFKEDKQLKLTMRNYEEILNGIKLNIQWRKLNEVSISNWIKKWKSRQHLRRRKANDY
uniref:Aminopeptidase n=1 Tax=Strongyloides papillosus TaxID=174720 RepID=A0A0N5BKL1_STREA